MKLYSYQSLTTDYIYKLVEVAEMHCNVGECSYSLFYRRTWSTIKWISRRQRSGGIFSVCSHIFWSVNCTTQHMFYTYNVHSPIILLLLCVRSVQRFQLIYQGFKHVFHSSTLPLSPTCKQCRYKLLVMGRACEVGFWRRHYYILSGSVLGVWTHLETVLT